MDYLALLEKHINTENSTLQNQHNPEKGGIDGFVGSDSECFEKNISDRRQALFRYHGIPDDDAQALANRLGIRDDEHDDRRSCAECVSFAPRSCRAGRVSLGTVSVFALHRSSCFQESHA